MLPTSFNNRRCSSTAMDAAERSFETQSNYVGRTPGLLPYETTSQDPSNWADCLPPPPVRSTSNESLSVNSCSESLDSHAAAGFAFPGRLHKMLRGVDVEGLSHIVSWQPHGRCFVVHKPKEFVRDILHNHFNQSKLTSFQRQLNLYGFSRITSGGPDRGSYYHPCFLRGRPGLCRSIDRQRVKGNGTRRANPLASEPRFYEMTPCLDSDSWASSRVPAVVSQINTDTQVKAEYPVQGTANWAWNQQELLLENDVSIPKIKEEEGLKRMVSLQVLPTQFLQKSIPELEPEPIPSYSAGLRNIMDRDATTLDQDVLFFLARSA